MLVLSTNVWASFPLANEANARFAGRYPHLWPLPAPLVRTRTGACEALGRCEADERLLDQLRDEIVADWIAGDPALVLIDKRERKSYLGDDPFDYEAFLASHPRWAEMRARYDEHGIVAGYAVLRRLPKTQNRHAP